MRKFQTEGEDSLPTSPIQRILAGAWDIPLVLDAAPTTVGDQLPTHGDIGTFGGNIYVRLVDTIYKFTGVAV